MKLAKTLTKRPKTRLANRLTKRLAKTYGNYFADELGKKMTHIVSAEQVFGTDTKHDIWCGEGFKRKDAMRRSLLV